MRRTKREKTKKGSNNVWFVLKPLPVHIIQRNVIAPVTTGHEMVMGTSIFDSHFGRNGSNSTGSLGEHQIKKVRVDPMTSDKLTIF